MDPVTYLVEEPLVVVGPSDGGEFRETNHFGQSTIVVRDAGPTLFLDKGRSRRPDIDGEEVGSLYAKKIEHPRAGEPSNTPTDLEIP